MRDLHFIEIGTSDHDTLLDNASMEVSGICIEPIKMYLDRLPDYPNVIKLNVAVSVDSTEGEVDLYYIPADIIESNPEYHLTLKGCNSVGKMHLQHIKWGLQDKVKTIKIRTVPLVNILKEYNVRMITHLKIDIEGGDSQLLLTLYEYLKDKSSEYWPNMITFESNELTPAETVTSVIDTYSKLGYKLQQRDFNTVLVR